MIRYGGVVLSSEEESVLSLPLKYAMYEDIDEDEMGLQLRKGGVKIRWSIREEEERGDEGVSDRELVETNHWVKGFNEVNWANMRVTNMKGNKRFFMPQPVKKKDFEIKWRSLKLECMEVTRNVKRSLQNKYHGKKFYNITDEQQKGMNSIDQRKKTDGLVIFESDKSSKLTVDVNENYAEKMKPHLENSEVVDMATVEKIEREMNARSKCWVRILNVGAAWGNEDRVKKSVTSSSGEAPVLYGL